MKTNYKIGETYYTYLGREVILKEIIKEDAHPLKCYTKLGVMLSYTLDGAYRFGGKPSLSTSPTEFIAPKEENFISWIDIMKHYNGNELLPPPGEGKFYRIENDGVYIEDVPKECFFNTEKIQKQRDVLKAIDLLKENGYIITKQY